MALNFLNNGYFAGKVGIGTESPSDTLTVIGDVRVTGVLKLASGSAGAPSLAHRSDENTGLFFPANDNIGFTTSNTERMRITSTGGISFGSTGTAYGTSGQVLKSNGNAAPTWIDGSAIPGVPAGSGTLNTVAMWTPDGDTLGDSILSQSGTNIYQGVAGTSASGYYYFNTTTTGDSGLLFADNTSTNSGFLTYNHDVNAMKFGTAGSERIRIDSAGNVGIGTTNPAQNFVVAEGTNQHGIELVPGTLSYIQAYDRATSDYGNLKIDAEYIAFGTGNGSERMRITSAGNVGIGTTSPDTTLEVQNPTLATDTVNTLLTQRWSRLQTGAVKWGNSMDLLLGSYESGVIQSRTRVDFKLANGATDDPDTTVMTLQANGNVGIGTTSPGAKLDVQTGDVRIYSGDGSTAKLEFKRTSDNWHSASIRTVYGGNYGSSIYFDTHPNDGTLLTSPTTKMVIEDDGNVGIGETSPKAKLNVTGVSGGPTVPISTSSDGIVRIESSNGGVGLDIGAQGASPYSMWMQVGNTSNSSGDTYPILLNPLGGNVGIGTTNPTEKLHIKSTVSGSFIRFEDNGGSGVYVGSRSNELEIYAGNSERMKIDAAGAIQFNAYNDANNTGTPTYLLGTDGSGNIVKTNTIPGSGAGPYLPLAGGTMTGTNGVIMPDSFPLFLGSSGINDSQIFWDGDNIEIQARKANADIVFRAANSSSVLGEFLAIDGGIGKTRAYKDIHFQDNIKATFGDATTPDLEIYHDGSNSYINETGTGNLYIKSAASLVLSNITSGSVWIECINNQVELKNAGSTKLQTTSTGVTLTGAATATTFLGDLNGTINTVTTGFTQANAVNNTTIATTAYVNNKIALIPAGLIFQGTWNAATNTPTLASGVGTTGNFYIVSVDGSTNLDGITDWKVGDWAVFVEVGATDAWQKIDNSSVLDGSGTGGTVTGWAGSGTSNTLTNSPITFSGNNIEVPGDVTLDNILLVPATLPAANTPSINLRDTNNEIYIQSGSAHVFNFIRYDNRDSMMNIESNGINVTGGGNFSGNLTLHNSSNAPYIDFTESGATGDSKARITMDQIDTDNGTLIFGTENAGTLYNQMKITETGNLLLSNDAASFNTTLAKVNMVPASNSVYQQWSYSPTDEIFALKLKETVTSGNVRYVFEQNNNGTTYSNVLVFNQGNVGIGTDSPGAKLDVQGTILVNNEIQFVDSNMRIFRSSNDMRFRTGGSDKVTIESGGNVGIGVTGPQAKLEVSQNMSNGAASAFTSPHLKLSALNTTDSTGFVGMTFATSSANNYGFSWGALRTVSALGGMHLRYHGNSAAGTDIFNIDYVGNVTIPSARLIRSDSSGGYLTIQGGATYPGGRIDMYGGSNASAGIEFLTGGATASPTSKMRIDSAGAIKFNAYDSTNNTGTPTYLLGTDADGNIVKSDTAALNFTEEIQNSLANSYYNFKAGEQINLGQMTVLENLTKFSGVSRVRVTTFRADDGFFGKGNSGTSRIFQGVKDTSGNVISGISNNSVSGYGYTTDTPLSLNTWHSVVTVFDGAGASNADRLKIYVDGVQRVLTFVGTISTTTPDNARDLYLGLESESAIRYLSGDISSADFYNRALSASEVLDISQGSPAAFADVGASGTELVTNGDFSSGTTGWGSVNGTMSVTAGVMELTNTAVYGYAYPDGFTTIVGKKYIGYVDVKSGTISSVSIKAGTAPGTGNLGNQTFTTTGAFVRYGYEFTATTTLTYLSVFNNSATIGATQYYDNMSVMQAGVVASYNVGKTAGTWYDNSGNDLDGTVNGAVLIQPENTGMNNLFATNGTFGQTVDPVVIIKSDAGGDPQLRFDASQANRGASIKFYDNGSVVGGFINYSHLNDRMDFGSGSSSSPTMTVADQAVGIGVTGPNAKLHVMGTTGLPATSGTTFTGTMRLGVSGGYGTVMDFGAVGPSTGTQWIQVTDSSNQALHYPLLLQPNGGNVGIGTTSPATELQIGDYTDATETITIATSNNGAGRINFYDQNDTEGGSIRVVGQNLGSKMYFSNRWNTDNDRVVFDLTTGNVGIGTTSPDGKLDIRESSGATSLYMRNLDTAQTDAGDVQNQIVMKGLYWSGDAASVIVETRINSVHQLANGNGGSALTFMTQTGGSGVVEQMRIDRDGKVGIGTDDPGAKLQIGDYSASGGNTLAILNSSGNQTLRLADSSAYYGFDIVNDDGGYLNIIRHANSIAGTSALLINRDTGNVGIGETSPQRQLHVNSGTTNVVARFESTDGYSVVEFKDPSGTAEIGNVGNDLVLLPAGVEKLRITSTGDIELASSSRIVLDDQPTASTASGSGTIVKWSVSAATTVGLMYILKFDGTWTATDADSEVKSTGMAAIALGTNANLGMLLQGFFYKSAHGFTIGLPLYISNTAGALTTTRPTGTNDYVRVVGYATSANYIYFDPDKTWVQVA
jgi:hypothetical protein